MKSTGACSGKPALATVGSTAPAGRMRVGSGERRGRGLGTLEDVGERETGN